MKGTEADGCKKKAHKGKGTEQQPLMAVLLTHHSSESGGGAKNSTQSQITMYTI